MLRRLRSAIPFALRALPVALLGILLGALSFWLVARQPWPGSAAGRSFLDFVGRDRLEQEAQIDAQVRERFPIPPGFDLDTRPTGLWQLRAIRAQEAWLAVQRRRAAGTSGPPVIIGVYDGPMAAHHPDLAPNLQDADPGNPWSTLAAWGLFIGHGTGVMGAIAGTGLPGMTGAAPNARLLPYHTVHPQPDRGMTAALAHFRGQGARLANFAIALPHSIGPEAAVVNARREGLLLITGLYNRETDAPAYPAAYPGTLTASGVGPDDQPLGFGWGPLVDVVAPGSGMPTTAPVLQAGGFLLGAPYQHLCCNSIASALVTGVAALVLEADPTLTPDQVEKRIKLSARKTAAMVDAEGRPVRWHPRYGYGVLDAYAAVRLDQIAPVFGAAAALESGGGWRISGSAGDDVLDGQLDPARARDRHLRGVPTSNIAAVEYRLGTGPWRAAPLGPAAEAHRTAYSFPVGAGEALQGGGTVEVRASDTAGNVSPSITLALTGPRGLDGDAVP